MGFGSYDESEQERQGVNTDIDTEGNVKSTEADHEGDIEYEGMGDTGTLLEQLNEIKEENEEEQE